MKAYEKYKKSMIPWVDKIPSHWELVRNGGLFNYHQDKVGEYYDQYELLSLSTQGIRSKSIEDVKGKVPASYEGYQKVNNGDMVFCLFDLDCSAVFAGLSEKQGMITSAYDVVTPKVQITNPQYLNYWFSAVFAGRHYKIYAKSVRYTINYDVFKAIMTPVPPRDEQDQIVRYLDWQVSKINHLIHGYQKQIKLLDERKCTQINQVLVSGLNSNVNTTQSKALWMEETPCHWTQYRVKDIMYEVNERSKEGKEPHLSMSQKYGLVTDDVDIERRLLSESYVGAKVCNKDDLVLNRLKAHLGVFALAPHLGVVSPDYTVLRLHQDRVIPKYAEYLLKCNDCRKELVIRVRGIVEGFWRLYTQDLYSIYICIPGIKEQEEILEYISQLEEKYQVVKDKLQKEVLLLKEYRTRLISDVVTGQIDVRDVVIPEYTPEEDTEIDIDDTGEDMEEVAEDAE